MEQRAHQPSSIGLPQKSRRISPAVIGSIIAVIVIILVAVAIFVFKPFSLGTGGFQTALKKDQYQAVFLTNGQVYFGKIDKIDGTGYTIKDIYYLQVQDGGQQTVQKTADAKSTDQSLSLAKLGSELHGPEDVMYIEGKQVLFWENLKEDGRVVKAIKDDKSK